MTLLFRRLLVAAHARLVTLLCSTLLAAACSDQPSDGGHTQVRASAISACRADLLEPDLEAEPLRGPGVDPDTGKLLPPSPGDTYVVSATYGVPRPGSDGAPVSSRYSQLFSAIEAQLAREAGLLALSLGTSASCHSGRTLAVWKSEEQMYAFVTSPAHLEAMRAAGEILMPGYAVTHWEARAPEEISMAEAVRRLAEADRAP